MGVITAFVVRVLRMCMGCPYAGFIIIYQYIREIYKARNLFYTPGAYTWLARVPADGR